MDDYQVVDRINIVMVVFAVLVVVAIGTARVDVAAKAIKMMRNSRWT